MFTNDPFPAGRKLSFAFLDHAHNFLQVFFAKTARFDEVDEERFSRAVKNAINEFADHAADDLILGMRGAIKEGAILAALLQVALGFEDFHHGHDGGVSDFAALKESFVNVADGGGAALPDELHDFEFLGGKSVVLGPHSRLLVLINSYVKHKDDAERSADEGFVARGNKSKGLKKRPASEGGLYKRKWQQDLRGANRLPSPI